MAKKKIDLDGLDFGNEPIAPIEQKTEEEFTPKANEESVRRISATLRIDDAVRFKRAAEDNGMSLHDALIEAVNRLMSEWQQPAIQNVGSKYKK